MMNQLTTTLSTPSQAAPALLPLVGGEVDPIRLDLPDTLSLQEWRAIGVRLFQLERSVPWAIGDWLLYGERKYGEMYTQALKATHYDYGTLRNWKHVAERVGLSRRRDNLSWSHHLEVASLPPSEQEMLIRSRPLSSWSFEGSMILLIGSPIGKSVPPVRPQLSTLRLPDTRLTPYKTPIRPNKQGRTAERLYL